MMKRKKEEGCGNEGMWKEGRKGGQLAVNFRQVTLQFCWCSAVQPSGKYSLADNSLLSLFFEL
jgi:hypothetical protein